MDLGKLYIVQGDERSLEHDFDGLETEKLLESFAKTVKSFR